uniref:Uncharacterized protein n=1 Tax=Panagrolaimus sp. JU765 TaxID=591449 RepID=A0AC34QZ68_9BILA
MFLFRQNYPDIEDPEYLKCCGHIHVRKLARYIAFIFLILTAFEIFLMVNYSRYYVIDFIFVTNVFIFVLLAEKLQKPGFYLPSLVYLGFYIIVGIPLLFICITVRFFTSPETLGPDAEKIKDVSEKLLFVFIIFATCAILEAIYIYFWEVIYDARHYMIKEVKSGNVAAAYASQQP